MVVKLLTSQEQMKLDLMKNEIRRTSQLDILQKFYLFFLAAC